MNKDFETQLLKIQALQIEAAKLGFCMHVIVRGGIKIENEIHSHIDASLFESNRQMYNVNEFEDYGENSISLIEDFIAKVTRYLRLYKNALKNGSINIK